MAFDGRISECRSRADFAAVASLLSEMAAWDVAEVGALGIPTQGLIELYYGEDADALMARFAKTGGTFLLARSGGVLGCVAVSPVTDGLAEIQKLYVRPEGRGAGLGRALLAAALELAGQGRFGRLRLATASFMASAIALYREFGFRDCEPFERTPDHLRPITLYMQREQA